MVNVPKYNILLFTSIFELAYPTSLLKGILDLDLFRFNFFYWFVVDFLQCSDHIYFFMFFCLVWSTYIDYRGEKSKKRFGLLIRGPLLYTPPPRAINAKLALLYLHALIVKFHIWQKLNVN